MTRTAGPGAGFRCSLRDRAQLEALAVEPLPHPLRETSVVSDRHRDIYFDTADRILRARGAACRLRHRSDGRVLLSLAQAAGDGSGSIDCIEAELVGPDLASVLEHDTEPARRLRAFTDPVLLGPTVELEVTRIRRAARAGLWRPARFQFVYDDVTLRHGAIARAFQELKVRRFGGAGPDLDRIARDLAGRHALRPTLASKLERAEAIRERLVEEALRLRLGPGSSVAIAVLNGDEIAVTGSGAAMRLPTGAGAGEAACRHVLHALFQSRVGQVHRVGAFTTDAGDRSVEVWLVRRVRGSAGEAPPRGIEWVPIESLGAMVGSGALDDRLTTAAYGLISASGLLSAAGPAHPSAFTPSRPVPSPPDAVQHEPADFLDGPRSELAFIARVLGLAEDARVPLLERIRYIAIVSSNLDEFYMGTAGALRQAVRAGSETDVAPLAAEVRALVSRQAEALRECVVRLAEEGVTIRSWQSLAETEREQLRGYFESDILPQLTPRAITTSPGHPFPLVPALALAFAVVLAEDDRPAHYAYLRLPDDLPRFLPVGSTGLLPVEELVRAELGRAYPDRTVAGASLFRITRLGDLDLDERHPGNLLQAMEEDVERRGTNPVVRVEVESTMPPALLDMLVRELRFGDASGPGGIGPEIERVRGLLALADVRELATAPVEGGAYPPFTPRDPLGGAASLWDRIRGGDVLVHHPYDDFGATVGRLVEEASSDPHVLGIRMTLYRAGDQSPLVDALQAAAQNGKDVSVFVELKARYDEVRNVLWARRLEAAGVNVVYGIVGLKNHAKVAMVVRREGEGIRRYVHVGTGNYNAGTARAYTDFGLLTADPVIGQDVADLFNGLTGTSAPPHSPFKRLLVAPARLLAEVVARIDREAQHASDGGGRIRIKCNGLADPEVVRALYRASQAGVEIDLIVRGICTLRPGVPGLSANIRVRSILGRFLEHGRIYHFGNRDRSEYFIGSADLRPRNLRRRIEVLVPVEDGACRHYLDSVLDLELRDPTAWLLGPDGTYAAPASAVGDPASAQQLLIDGGVS